MPNITLNTTTIGRQIENLAIIYLKNHNLLFLDQNFKTKFGEIDLIFKDPLNNQIVFVEVRYRKSTFFGVPAETVNKTKQRKIINTANYYIKHKFINQQLYYRFDIIACTGPLDNIKVDWLQNAFC